MRLKDIDKIQITPYDYTNEELSGIRKLLGIMDDLPTVETDSIHAVITAVPNGAYTTPLTVIKSHLVQMMVEKLMKGGFIKFTQREGFEGKTEYRAELEFVKEGKTE